MWEKLSLSDSEGSRYVMRDCVEEGEFFVTTQFFTGQALMACLEVKKRRGSRVKGERVI